MESDSVPTFISRRNKRIWEGKRQELGRPKEVFYNIALQTGIPPLSRSKLVPILKIYTDCIKFGGRLIYALVLILTIWWFVSAISSHFSDIDMLGLTGFMFLVSLWLLLGWSRDQPPSEQLAYPPCLMQLYKQLIVSGEVTTCEVHDTETLNDSMYLIRYRFTSPKNGERVEGKYVTNRAFSAGTKMAIIYLDSTCHVLL
jgi:hypothetical protein